MTNPLFGSQLLYRASTGLERSLVDVDSARITEIPAELIKDIWDPYRCPARLLPYLAFAMGVEFWNDDWSETTKRVWIANQWLFKSLRGTKAGLEMAVDFAGRDVSKWGYRVTKVYRQPTKVFSGPSLTREEREAWLQRLPQVRTWRVRETTLSGVGKAFYGASAHLRLHSSRFCLGGGAATPSTALQRLHRRARWVEGGVETDTRVDEFGSYFRLHRQTLVGRRVISGMPARPGRYLIPSDAWKRLVTIEPKARLPWRSATTPTLQAVTSEPERVKVAGTRGRGVFADVPLRGFWVPTSAPLRIFQRYAVLDPSVREFRRGPVQFMGTGRFGFPAFTAWAEVTVGNVLNKRAAGFGFWLPRQKFFLPHNGKPIEEVRAAVRASKALRDKILLRIGKESKFVAGNSVVLAGTVKMPAI